MSGENFWRKLRLNVKKGDIHYTVMAKIDLKVLPFMLTMCFFLYFLYDFFYRDREV